MLDKPDGIKIEIPTMASLDDVNFYRRQLLLEPSGVKAGEEIEQRESSNYAFLRDEQNQICGGAYVHFVFDLISIDSFWVSPKLRRQGLGARLYRALEDLAYVKKKKNAVLSTFEFQNAVLFWERVGFQEFARLPGYPKGSQLIYFSKKIEAENRTTAIKNANK